MRPSMRVLLLAVVLIGLIGGVSAEVPDDPIHYWGMDAGSGINISDRAGNSDLIGNDNSLSNGWATKSNGETVYEWNSQTDDETTFFEGTTVNEDFLNSENTVVFRASQVSSSNNVPFFDIKDEGSCGFSSYGFGSGDTARQDVRDCSNTRDEPSAGTAATSNFEILTFQRDGGNWEIYVNGNLVDTTSITGNTYTGYEHLKIGDWNSQYHSPPDGKWDYLLMYDYALSDSQINEFDSTKPSFNTPPSINSVSTSPSIWTLGSSIDVSAEVSDPDGNLDTVTADVWENGTKIVSSASLNNNSGTWEIDNLFNVDESNVYYNYTLTATDDGGATGTYSDSQFIKDLAPQVSIVEPGNSTYFSYDVPYQVDVDTENDNLVNQSFSCDFSSNGTVFRSVSGYGSDSFSGNFSEGLGQNIEFRASCSDPGGTSNKSEYFTVEDFQVDQVFSISPVYETENVTFESEIYQGDMVESVNYSLIWDGEEVNQASQSLDAEGTLIQDLDHTIPLVSSNNTQKNWEWNFTVERQDFSGGLETESYSSSVQSQDVLWSYWITGSTALYDQEGSSQVKILEGQDAGHRVNVSRETTSATLTGEMDFNRTDGTVEMNKEVINSSALQFEASELSDKISQSLRTDQVSSDITVSFQGDSRKINASDTVETHKIVFDQGSEGSTDALKFDVIDENDFSNTLTSDLDIAVEFWAENSSERVTRSFSTASDGKTTHSFQISPSWAELVVDSSEKLIQYQDANGNYRLRSYFLLEEKVDSSATTIDLYALKKDASSRIGIETVDSDGSTIPEIIVRAERYFPAEDKSISVAMARTGSDGRTESFFEVNEIYYGFKFYEKDDSGSYELVSEEPQQIISQDLLRFTISDVQQIGYYDFREGIGSSCEYNATQVRCSYTSQEAVEKVTLEVEEERPIAWETVCEQVASTASGELICDGLNATDKDFSYSFEATSGDGDTITLDTGRSGEGSQGYGDAGLMISFFLFVTLGLGSLAGPRPIPEISVLLTTVAVVVSYTSGLLAITYQAAATFVILGAITIYKMRNDAGGGVI